MNTILKSTGLTALLVAAALITGCASDKSESTTATGVKQEAALKHQKPAKNGATGRMEAMQIQMPAPGKSKVVFIRPGTLGSMLPFYVHDDDKLIGVLKANSYFVYECDPGNHLFSTSMEGVAMLDASLLPDRIYYAKVSAAMGVFVAEVNMYSLHPGCAGDLWRKLPTILPHLHETVASERGSLGSTNYIKRVQIYHKYEYLPDQHREQILPEHGQLKPIGVY